MDPAPTKQLPTLTVPQWLAFLAFLAVVGLGVLHDNVVEPAELSRVRILAAVLIAALLPSDALIRYGRTLWAKSPAAEEQKEKKKDEQVSLADAPKSTLPQILAFLAFLITAVLVLVPADWVSGGDFKQVEQLLRVLIVALLPSDAAIRFARARYLGTASNVTAAHLKQI